MAGGQCFSSLSFPCSGVCLAKLAFGCRAEECPTVAQLVWPTRTTPASIPHYFRFLSL